MKQRIVCIVLVLFACEWGPVLWAGEVYSDRVAAVVNGNVILESQVKRYREPFIRRHFSVPLGIVPPGKWPTEKEILDELIVMRLLEGEAAKKGIKITDEGANRSLEALQKRNHLTHDQFVLYLAANGMNYADYRRMYKRQLLLTGLIGHEVARQVNVTEKEAQTYFKEHQGNIEEEFRKLTDKLSPGAPPEETKPEIPTHTEVYVGGEVRLRRIVLKPAGSSRKDRDKMLQTAKKIYADAQLGADFASLAKKYSQDPTAAKGGDLGFMKYRDLVPVLQKMVEQMHKGSLSPPLVQKDSVIIFNLADERGRKLKKVPIPEKTRKELEKRLQEAQEKRRAQAAQQGISRKNHSEEKRGPEEKAKDVKGKATDNESKPLDILTPAEEKEYKKVRDKVIEILRSQGINDRLKEWIEGLKKNSIIEVKL